MNKIEPKTLKGFRDYLPSDARKRQYIVTSLRKTFESFGFEPLETPALEYEEILAGKYGEEGERLMYRFEDKGGRRVAMRYDQTVPLARVVAQYGSKLPFPFKRYQISNVWRGENTQKGRFREFTQCDIDTVGVENIIADADVIACAAAGLEALGFEKYKILINDRQVFGGLSSEGMTDEKLPAVIRAIDKIKKIGRDNVIVEIVREAGISKKNAESLVASLENAKPTKELTTLFATLEKMGVKKERFEFVPFLARGLDYYTGTIFEIEVEGYDAGSVCGGGRYNKLVGMFAGKDIPAVGCAFGFNRLVEAMEGLNLFHDVAKVSTTRILVTVLAESLLDKSIELLNYIRKNGLNAEIYPDTGGKLEKQIKYADKKGIMYAAILGPEEIKDGTVTIKNLRVRDQQTVAYKDLLKVI